jgi:phage tail-like protein
VKWDGRYIASVSYVSPLRRLTDVVEIREGGGLSVIRKTPGLTRFAPITIRRGVTQDADFENWSNKVWNGAAGAEVSLKDFRKDVTIELYNEAGQLVKRYIAYRCWPAKYEALTTLDANNQAILLESLTLEFEGWERDPSVTEPAQAGSGVPR